jgi:NodT family efflux transporter outer membrane factor (OMF) lipoprotein
VRWIRKENWFALFLNRIIFTLKGVKAMLNRQKLPQCLIGMIPLLLLFSGCAMVGPDYIKPPAPEQKAWIEHADPKIKAEPTDLAKWWLVFDDPVLNSLVEQAYQQNLPLRIAGLRILEARAQLGIASGNLYPQQQQGTGGAAYNKISQNRLNLPPGFADQIDTGFNTYDLAFDAFWELDFWGKFRRNVESGLGTLEASIASYDDTLVTLTAEVARTYVVIRTFEERLEIARENVRIQERSLRITEVRFEGGEVSELDVTQAKALLSETQALIPRLARDLRQAKNALSTLLGKLPSELNEILGGPQRIPAVPAKVAVGVPAQLLRRRPDIRLAERQIAAQSPRIGVAKAELYPAFNLLGTIGLSSRNSSNFFDADSVKGLAGPSFTWNILNYGRIKNNVRVQDARFQELAVNYQNTVLRAAREVEDAMVAFLRTQEEAKFLLSSVRASKRSVDLSLLQYREGLVDYQRVLDTQRFLTRSQEAYTATRGDIVINLVAMYKALGGGWQIREGKDFVPEQIKVEMQQRTDWGKLLSLEEQEPPPEEDRKLWRSPDW